MLPEAPALVPGLHDLAMVRETVEQGRRHLSVAEHQRPLQERQVRLTMASAGHQVPGEVQASTHNRLSQGGVVH